MTREIFQKSFNRMLRDLKESIANKEDSHAMESYYRGKCAGMIMLAFDLGIIDNTDYMVLGGKIFNA